MTCSNSKKKKERFMRISKDKKKEMKEKMKENMEKKRKKKK